MAWNPSGVMQTLNGRSDVKVVPKATAGWERSDYSFGKYRTADQLGTTPAELTSYPDRTFTSTAAIRDRDVARYWEDQHNGVEPAGLKSDPGAARTNRIASNKANIKVDGDLRPGEQHKWGQTTSQHFFPKLDAPTVARETRAFGTQNKQQNREAHVRLEDF